MSDGKQWWEKPQVKTYRVVQDRLFDKWVQNIYNVKYEFVADQEASNDSSHVFNNITVEDRDKWMEWDRSRMLEFVSKGEYNYLARTLLGDMVANGRIPPGNYLIEVSW